MRLIARSNMNVSTEKSYYFYTTVTLQRARSVLNDKVHFYFIFTYYVTVFALY